MGTRDDILEAANRAYSEKGYAGLSMRAIAKEVGITAMAIYRHFEDKDHLMHHVVLHGLSLWQKELAPLSKITNPWERIQAVGDAYVRFAHEHRSHFELTFLSTDRVKDLRNLTDQGTQAFNSLFGTFASWVAECFPQKSADESRDIAIDIWAYTHGLLALHLAGRLSFLDVDFASYHAKKLAKYLKRLQRPK